MSVLPNVLKRSPLHVFLYSGPILLQACMTLFWANPTSSLHDFILGQSYFKPAFLLTFCFAVPSGTVHSARIGHTSCQSLAPPTPFTQHTHISISPAEWDPAHTHQHLYCRMSGHTHTHTHTHQHLSCRMSGEEH